MRAESREGGPRPGFWATRAGARVALVALHATAALVLVIEALRPLHEDPHPVERVRQLDFFASYGVYGFAACVLLVLLGLLLRRVVMRSEDYYERGQD